MFKLNERLFELRKEKGLTQEEVAKNLGVSPQSVSKWENGLTYPDISLLPSIADFYGVSVDYLLGKDETKNRQNTNPTIHIHVQEEGQEEVNIHLPYFILKTFLKKGMHLGTEKSDTIFSSFNLEEAVEQGVRGKVLEVKEKEGTLVTIEIE